MNKVLVLQLSRFGDVIQSTPLLKNLKDKNYITYFLVDEKNIPMCKDIPVIDYVIPLELRKIINFLKKKDLKSLYNELDTFLKRLQNEQFDLLINLNHSQINLLISNALTIPGKKGFKVSESPFINFLYSIINTSRKINPFNLVDVFNYFLYDFKIQNLQINSIQNYGFDIPNDYIVLHLGAGHNLRILDLEIMAEFSKRFLEEFENFYIVLTGTKDEERIGKKFLERVNTNKVINFIGKTDYYQLKLLLKKSKLLISTDTGVMHLGAALRIKILSLFFASAFPFETGPYVENALIITPNLDCYPCKEFAYCKDLKCKKIITEKIILKCCNFLLKNDSENFNDENVIIYTSYFDDHGIYLKELSNNFDKFYKQRLEIRDKGLKILNESV